MAKKPTTSKTLKPHKIESAQKSPAPLESSPNLPPMNNLPKLPPELEKKLKILKDKLDIFKDKVLEKFGDYIVGIVLLPPEKALGPEGMPPMGQAPNQFPLGSLPPGAFPTPFSAPMPSQAPSAEKSKDTKDQKEDQKIQLLVVVDDTDSQKMSKDELHAKFSGIINNIAQDLDKNIVPQSLLLTDIWQNCYDAKYDLNRLISLSAPIYDRGMMAAIKIAEIHKNMVMKKFEKYVLSYVLAGSLTQGKATPTSDIDVWIVIDDTDVKKMTRLELKDKLRGIIIGMGMEAGEITGIKNKINIQVYILTDFWDSLKEANPIIFTLLRDGVPFYDRGIFLPWKQLLRMGRIKPSREAIDLFMSTGDQSIKRVKYRLKEMGMEDCFYAILTPSQAAIMLYGLPPPTPRETPEVLEKIFVQKEKMLEPEYVKILKDNVDLRKKIEHGDKKDLTGAELDVFINNAEKFLNRLSELFTQIEQRHNEKSIVMLYEEVITLVRDILKIEGIQKAKEEELLDLFNNEVIVKGKIASRTLRDIQEIVDAKKKFDQKKLDKNDIELVRKNSGTLIRTLIEYIQRKRSYDLERSKIRVKYGEKYGEVVVFDGLAFITIDLDAKPQTMQKAKVNGDGSLGSLEESSLEDFEKHLMKAAFPKQVLIKEALFEELKNIFGRHVEIML